MTSFFIVAIAQYAILFIPLLVVAAFLQLDISQKKRLVLTLVIGSVVGLLLLKLASTLFYDPRPFMSSDVQPLFKHAADNGFPSDHTTLSALMAFIVLAFSRKIGIIMTILAVAIGSARVFAHVHSWIDILGGLLVAGLAAYVAITVQKAIISRKNTSKEAIV
jgi:undecaprenyl-diphosphatase